MLGCNILCFQVISGGFGLQYPTFSGHFGGGLDGAFAGSTVGLQLGLACSSPGLHRLRVLLRGGLALDMPRHRLAAPRQVGRFAPLGIPGEGSNRPAANAAQLRPQRKRKIWESPPVQLGFLDLLRA